MQDKGGTVILHGYTHQYKKEEVSGEGMNFGMVKRWTLKRKYEDICQR